jgi:hypothetical protein
MPAPPTQSALDALEDARQESLRLRRDRAIRAGKADERAMVEADRDWRMSVTVAREAAEGAA